MIKAGEEKNTEGGKTTWKELTICYTTVMEVVWGFVLINVMYLRVEITFWKLVLKNSKGCMWDSEIPHPQQSLSSP